MAEQLEFFPVQSPCRGICQSDERGFCRGCFRSREERFHWQTMSDAQKQDAVAQMVAMTEIAEKETAAETMLASKGFLDSVVSISEDSADVVVNASELTEANRAQIEDIVTRKTGVAAQNIVITPVYAEGK